MSSIRYTVVFRYLGRSRAVYQHKSYVTGAGSTYVDITGQHSLMNSRWQTVHSNLICMSCRVRMNVTVV